MKQCSVCGYSGNAPLHKHHVKVRKFSNETILLCPNCHAEQHQAMIVVDNEASRKATEILNEIDKTRFLSQHEMIQILKQQGYEPRFDEEPSPEEF